MGFIASKGPGTDEILQKLQSAFFANAADTATRHVNLFGPGKQLVDAARTMQLAPTDGGHRGQWMKWLIWLQRHPNQHEQIRLFLFNTLQARQPCILDWQEDPSANPKTPPRITTTSQQRDGRMVGVLTVITCTAAKIPD